jgi:hypothetical protein
MTVFLRTTFKQKAYTVLVKSYDSVLRTIFKQKAYTVLVNKKSISFTHRRTRRVNQSFCKTIYATVSIIKLLSNCLFRLTGHHFYKIFIASWRHRFNQAENKLSKKISNFILDWWADYWEKKSVYEKRGRKLWQCF